MSNISAFIFHFREISKSREAVLSVSGEVAEVFRKWKKLRDGCAVSLRITAKEAEYWEHLSENVLTQCLVINIHIHYEKITTWQYQNTNILTRDIKVLDPGSSHLPQGSDIF